MKAATRKRLGPVIGPLTLFLPGRKAWLVALAAHVVLLALFQPVFTVVKMPDTPAATRFAMQAGGGDALRETPRDGDAPQSPTERTRGEFANEILTDNAPLYLPTKWNYGQSTARSFGTDFDETLGGTPLGAFVPRLRVSPDAPLLRLDTAPADKADSPLEPLFAPRFWNVASTFGLQAQPGPSAPAPRQAFMQVEDAATGAVMFAEAVNLGLSEESLAADWAPAAFSYSVDDQGPVGPPVAIPLIDNKAGSGNATVDAAMKRHIILSAPATRLPPGYYRILIGP